MLSIPIHVRAIDTNPPKCYQYQSTLEYSQRGSFELVLLVASALSRWFFSVVIASNSLLSVVALNFDISPSCCLCIIKVVFQRGYCFKLYSQRGSFEFWLLVLLVASALSRWFFSVVIASKLCSQRGSFELLALWTLLYYVGVRIFFRTVSVYWQHFDYLFHVSYNICDSFRSLTTHNCQFELTANLLNFMMWFISWRNL